MGRFFNTSVIETPISKRLSVENKAKLSQLETQNTSSAVYFIYNFQLREYVLPFSFRPFQGLTEVRAIEFFHSFFKQRFRILSSGHPVKSPSLVIPSHSTAKSKGFPHRESYGNSNQRWVFISPESIAWIKTGSNCLPTGHCVSRTCISLTEASTRVLLRVLARKSTQRQF